MNNTQKQEYIGYKKYTRKELLPKTEEANKELRNILLEGDYYSQSPWLICISWYPSSIIALDISKLESQMTRGSNFMVDTRRLDEYKKKTASKR
jgi:hypothetical protein